MNKFVYTAADADGCILQAPNYTECKDCIFNFEDTPNACPPYPQQKPSSVIYDGHKCNKKRTE